MSINLSAASSHLLTYMPPGLKMILLRGQKSTHKGCTKKPWLLIDGKPFDIPGSLARHILNKTENIPDHESGIFPDSSTSDDIEMESDSDIE
uniref:LO6b n=1 Tax=Bueycito anole adomavirus TaxID=2609873 RepID=A0A6F9EZD6_9VIRU|nr:TPA_asm: LO6b [Bueycito anole adomavirus]